MRKLSFIDLERQQTRIRADLDRRIAAVLDSGDYILGSEIGELEESLRAFTGARHCITCSSGSAGLLMAVMALDLPKDATVLVPAFTFFASVEMPVLAGLKPVFVDIDPVFFQMSPEALEKSIKENGIENGLALPVDLFGQPAPYDAILKLAKKFGLYTIEDAAQSFGASYNGKKTCNLGCDVAVTSFFPAKPLGCYGDGGAVFTNDAALAAKLLSIRVHGQGADKYDNARLGINGRLDTMQAAVLLAKLEIFADEIERRNSVARMYNEALRELPEIRVPAVAQDCTDVWAQYCILLPAGERETVRKKLAESGIPTNVYYPTPLPFLQAFSHLNIPHDKFPVASDVSQRILALPCHPYLEKDDILYIAQTLAGALK